ncbi:MAG: Gfo/Idh/MocA family oxidoreductase [Candidatus Hydrogenedentes bacterium]|nr:Gfo/Idh/MocA family oxidoreductase [Candidatus Hydrogenedentota bacterium]
MAISRRQFLSRSSAVIVAGTMVAGKVFGANEKVNMAVIGFNGRGGNHIEGWRTCPNSQLVAICDVDENVHPAGLKRATEDGAATPKTYTDLRLLLEDKDVDAVSIATPNHWHTLASIWAMEAGKDVYVEKPCSHNVWEGRQLINAAKKYNRIVQHGTQIRSSKGIIEAMQHLKDGLIGDVYMARGLCYKERPSIGKSKPAEVPAGLDWNLWLGPAQERPWLGKEGGDPGTDDKNKLGGIYAHYLWHYFLDFGNGDLGNQGVHQMDVARWGLGVGLPSKVSGMGGLLIFDDAKEVPNVTTTQYFYPDAGERGRMLVFEVRPWLTNSEGGVSIGNLFYGSKGIMSISDYTGYKTMLCDEDGKNRREGPSRDEGGDHYGNFIDAVKARDPKLLNAPIEEGHYSSALCHLGMISVRLGRSLDFDPATEQFVNDAEANRMLTREYRKGFEVPKVEA